MVEDNKDTPTAEKVVAGWGKALQLHTVFSRSDAMATIISLYHCPWRIFEGGVNFMSCDIALELLYTDVLIVTVESDTTKHHKFIVTTRSSKNNSIRQVAGTPSNCRMADTQRVSVLYPFLFVY